MEASLQELRDTLAVERETQIKILQQEQEQIRSQQAEEFKKRLEDDRRLLEQQTLEQVAKFEQELAHKMEEERANLEKVHNEQVQELTRKNELEAEVTRTQLQAELSAHKHELQQAHLQVSGAATHYICKMAPDISVKLYCYFLFRVCHIYTRYHLNMVYSKQ
jgi:Signal transduction histidine kinase regulating C4-dicarboxylate transport system